MFADFKKWCGDWGCRLFHSRHWHWVEHRVLWKCGRCEREWTIDMD